MQQIRVSLVIPVYNRPELVGECLASLQPSLSRLHEVIVVDDGSTDGRTPQAVLEAIATLGAGGKIRLISQANAGPGAARNTGVRNASGNWVFFLDSDDLWFPWTAEVLITVLRNHPDARMLFMNVFPFQALNDIPPQLDMTPVVMGFDTFFELRSAKPAPALLGAGYFAIRRDLFPLPEGFVPHLKGAEDTDLFYRLAGEGQFIAVQSPRTVAQRTSNADSLTLNMSAVYEGMDFMLKGYQEGRYRDVVPGDVERSMADIMSFWLHTLFWQGYGREAYFLLLRRGVFGMLMRNGHRAKAMKLLFVPVLSILRPHHHRFRWRPKHAV